MEPSHSRTKSPRRGAYLLPSMFTVANIFCGFFALTESFKAGQVLPGNVQSAALHFDYASMAIGFAVLFDGMDGRIARLMGTSSAFGMELDSIADAITFGLAPAFLAYSWGVHAVLPSLEPELFQHLSAAGWLVSFLFVISSAARLARFNIQSTSTSATFRTDQKKFIGLPTPAAAGLIAAIVHFNRGNPVGEWVWVPFWLMVMLAASALMISTWRYHSFKDLDFRRKRKFVVVIALAGLGALIWFYSQIVLLVIATTYVFSGVVVKLAHGLRRNRMEGQVRERKA
jgi:CDP-diacylglycerol--serine O-phosphatidyltransferase